MARFYYIMILLNGLSLNCVKWSFVFFFYNHLLFSRITRSQRHGRYLGTRFTGTPRTSRPASKYNIILTICLHPLAWAIIHDFNIVFRKRNSYNWVGARCRHSSWQFRKVRSTASRYNNIISIMILYLILFNPLR